MFRKYLLLSVYFRLHFPTLLNNKKGEKASYTPNRWEVDVNLTLESDL